MAWNEETNKKIIIRAWKDEAFRKKLLNSPKEAFKEYGFDIPEGVTMHVVQADTSNLYYVLPPPPPGQGKLSKEELEKVAAGFGPGDATWWVAGTLNPGRGKT